MGWDFLNPFWHNFPSAPVAPCVSCAMCRLCHASVPPCAMSQVGVAYRTKDGRALRTMPADLDTLENAQVGW